MKLIFIDDSGKETVFQNVTDLYIAVRNQIPMVSKVGSTAMLPETRSYSWGSNLRELTKEVQQSLVELQDAMRSKRDGGNPS